MSSLAFPTCLASLYAQLFSRHLFTPKVSRCQPTAVNGPYFPLPSPLGWPCPLLFPFSSRQSTRRASFFPYFVLERPVRAWSPLFSVSLVRQPLSLGPAGRFPCPVTWATAFPCFLLEFFFPLSKEMERSVIRGFHPNLQWNLFFPESFSKAKGSMLPAELQ